MVKNPESIAVEPRSKDKRFIWTPYITDSFVSHEEKLMCFLINPIINGHRLIRTKNTSLCTQSHTVIYPQ